jgi:SAM-dependent methyltransferase
MADKKLRISNHYLGDAGKNYFAKGFKTETQPGRLFQLEYFKPFCNDRLTLLDFGCADGFFLRNLPAKKRIGVEANSAARLKCVESCQDGCSIKLHETLSTIRSGSIDIAISNHCLEHVPNPLENLEELYRVLKKDGVFVLIVPFDDWRNSDNKKWKPADYNHHLYTWSPMNIGNLVTEAKFKVLDTKICTQAWSPKILWINRFFGNFVFRYACFMLSALINRREVFLLAKKT